jgi:hypothetical protein
MIGLLCNSFSDFIKHFQFSQGRSFSLDSFIVSPQSIVHFVNKTDSKIIIILEKKHKEVKGNASLKSFSTTESDSESLLRRPPLIFERASSKSRLASKILSTQKVCEKRIQANEQQQKLPSVPVVSESAGVFLIGAFLVLSLSSSLSNCSLSDSWELSAVFSVSEESPKTSSKTSDSSLCGLLIKWE